MPDATEQFTELMVAAEAAAWKKSESLPGTFKTAAYGAARKAIKTSPSKAVVVAVAHIPIVGPALSGGASLVATKIRGKRIAGTLGETRTASTFESSKALMKGLADLATQIDGNLLKQKDAFNDLASAQRKLQQIVSVPGATAGVWTDGFWNAAYAYYRVDHYNLKLAGMIDTANDYLGRVGKFVTDSHNVLSANCDNLRESFVAAFEDVDGERHHMMARGRSSSTS